MTAAPLPEPMQIGFLVYLIDLVRCKRGGGWTGEQRVRTGSSTVVIPTKTLAKWLLALRIGSTFSADGYGATIKCSDALSEGSLDAAATGAPLLAVLPSCQLLVEHLKLAGALSGVMESIDKDKYREAFEGVVRLREGLASQAPVSAAAVGRANEAGVAYGASLAHFVLSVPRRGWRVAGLKLHTWNTNLTRRLVDKVYTFVPAAEAPAPHQPGPERSSLLFRKTEAVIRDHADFFARRVGASIFCATGERGGVAVFAEAAAGSLVSKLMQWYTWQAPLPSLEPQSSPKVLSDLTGLLGRIDVKETGGVKLYEVLALILYAMARMNL
ncbi:hypothetical protein CSUI_002878 [Cystoisospora suis]|uniref:Uncharacterized protein n=1 Tax=Cystoisospora suis TaxID=483139 RepID=A0A2C6KGW1_9APIC|nr:hypothetical protein CSUI_002878 [Cystoisospora suis]